MNCYSQDNFQLVFKYLEWSKHQQRSADTLQDGFTVGTTWISNEQNVLIFKNGSYLGKVDSQIGLLAEKTEENTQAIHQLFCGLVTKAAAANLPPNYTYSYTDGSNNNWKISDASIDYQPVAPIHSSSGVYSGGQAYTKAISTEQYAHISNLLSKALLDEGQQIPERSMGSGTIVVYIQEVSIKRVFLGMQSTAKETLENWLKAQK